MGEVGARRYGFLQDRLSRLADLPALLLVDPLENDLAFFSAEASMRCMFLEPHLSTTKGPIGDVRRPEGKAA